MRRVYLDETHDRSLRELAARFDLWLTRGVGAYELGNAHALMQILAAAASQEPDALTEALAPFVARYRPVDT